MHVKNLILSRALGMEEVGSDETQAGNLKHINPEGSWNICSIENSHIHSTYYSVPSIVLSAEMTKIKQMWCSKPQRTNSESRKSGW